ncbi:MAG: hypothetical protein JWM68_2043 [Verrucomicrobiales bacterium]|nr:hypothetical protein [Verrucomicrobiales bacterium]
MHVAILPDQVLLGGHDLLQLRETERFLACFEKPSRQREIPMHPSGTRVAMVWDSLGFVAYEDRPDRLMSHLYLAFDTKDTPEHPRNASNSIIEINGGMVMAETLERTLPGTGATPISESNGKYFFYESDAYCVHFSFKRRATGGRNPMTGHLVSFSFSWPKLQAVRRNHVTGANSR